MSNLKKTVFSAICVALCVVLPWAFHIVPDLASVISPMHIPVLLCGLVCGPLFGFAAGLLGPALSSAITGMPMAAYLPPMLVELAVYGLTSGLLHRFIRTKNAAADLYISLVGSMVFGRIAAAIVKRFVFAPGSFTLEVWISSYFVTALPGIVIHLILIPVIIAALKRAKLIEKRY